MASTGACSLCSPQDSVEYNLCFMQVIDEEMAKLREQKGDQRYFGGHFEEARGLFSRFSTSEDLSDFLTIAAYDYVVDIPSQKVQSRM